MAVKVSAAKQSLVKGHQYRLLLVFCGSVVLFAALVLVVGCAVPAASLPYTISGTVADAGRPVAGAIVKMQGTSNQMTTGKDGAFLLHGEGLGGSKVATVTAWAEGHFIGWVTLDPQKPIWKAGGAGVTISLRPLYASDNNQYTWNTSASCGMCHREYKEWQTDAHSQSATDPHFVTMYQGTNVRGQSGQPTQLLNNFTALPPDPSKPYYGPGYRLDYPLISGNCSTCHTPMASHSAIDDNCAWAGCHTSATADQSAALGQGDIRGVTPVGLEGVGTEGVGCDFCHKVGSVILDPKTHLPFPDSPGILSVKLYRPSAGEQLFFGPMTDVSRQPASYLPLETQSEFCAPCHYGVFGGVVGDMEVTGGTVIYNSYGEWLKSPYSAAETGKSCQDCHMPAPNTNFSAFLDKGGIPRDHTALHSHTMRGIADQSLMSNAVTMKSNAAHNGGTLLVQVSVTNDKTGHDVPTDQPMRSVMLVVEALGADGKRLSLSQGLTLPSWTGNYAGQPGKVFAEVLKDNWTGETPTVAIWRPVTVVADTRLAPFATDATAYSFNLPAGAAATVRVKLVYRLAFQQLEQQKGWNDPDIIMAEATIPVEK